MSDAVRAERIAHEVDYAARQLAQAGRLDLTREFIQHGDVTVYAHVTSVARASLSFAERLGRAGISVDRASLLRGALLHDYFLYDWHDPDPSHRLHGFRHPFFALARAEEDFELTPREVRAARDGRRPSAAQGRGGRWREQRIERKEEGVDVGNRDRHGIWRRDACRLPAFGAGALVCLLRFLRLGVGVDGLRHAQSRTICQ